MQAELSNLSGISVVLLPSLWPCHVHIDFSSLVLQSTRIFWCSFLCLCKEIAIPEGVKVLSNSIFAGCTQLEKITLPSTLEAIEQFALSGCMIKSIVIPNGAW